jgi:hypothetical protein
MVNFYRGEITGTLFSAMTVDTMRSLFGPPAAIADTERCQEGQGTHIKRDKDRGCQWGPRYGNLPGDLRGCVVPLLPPQGCISIGMGLAEGRFSALQAAYKEHRRPQGPQRQRPIGDIEPRGGSGR